jgi:nucleoside-diphosphate-sugar epimerase
LTRSLVTGAAGFVGSRLALALRAENQEVRAFVRPTHDAAALEAAGVEVVRGDASDSASVTRAAEGCQTIYHLAAARGVRKLGSRAYGERNRKLSESVGKAALAARVERVVITTAAMVTGYSGPDVQSEETPARPNSGYRVSRLTDEEIFLAFAKHEGLDVVIARLPKVLGPGARDWARTFRSVRDRRIRFVPEGGTFHSGDVEDIVDALKRCGGTPGIGGRRFVLAAANPIPTIELLRTIAERLGVPLPARTLPAAPFRAYLALGDLVFRRTRLEPPYHWTTEFFCARIAFDIGRARRELGWAPRYELAESARRTVDWLREEGLV